MEARVIIISSVKSNKSENTVWAVAVTGEEQPQAYCKSAYKAMRFAFLLKKRTGLNISENCLSRLSQDIKEHKAAMAAKVQEKIIIFLTGMENSGKVLFSTFYISPDGHEQHDVVITKVETDKEGGDWSTDIVEAINMFCFTMRVHSNLVGSVPGKTQTNNSGSDKRELYTIAQALQKPYHDLLFTVHNIIIRFNDWTNVKPDCPFIMLSTLDENRDAKLVTTNTSPDQANQS